MPADPTAESRQLQQAVNQDDRDQQLDSLDHAAGCCLLVVVLENQLVFDYGKQQIHRRESRSSLGRLPRTGL